MVQVIAQEACGRAGTEGLGEGRLEWMRKDLFSG